MKEFIKEFKEFISPILGLFGGMSFQKARQKGRSRISGKPRYTASFHL